VARPAERGCNLSPTKSLPRSLQLSLGRLRELLGIECSRLPGIPSQNRNEPNQLVLDPVQDSPTCSLGNASWGGRFVFEWWRKKKTPYALPDERLLILGEVRNRKLTSVHLTENTFLVKSTRPGGMGTLQFAMPQVTSNRGSSEYFDSDGRPSFRDIDEVERVCTLISRSQARLRSESCA
jgi:hypothetical protein